MSAEIKEASVGNRRLWKGILQLTSGTAVSQLIVLLTTPVITRFYSPHDFGIAAFFLSFLMFMAPLATLNYYQAIILPKNEQNALNVCRLCIIISLGMFTLIYLPVFYLLRPALGSFFKMPELMPIFWLIPVAILLRSLYLILTSYTARRRAFVLQSRARIAQTLTERGLALALGFAGQVSSLTLVFTRFISSMVETTLLFYAFLRREPAPETDEETQPIGELAKGYREFPLYSSSAMLLANGSSQLPLLLLPVLYSPSVCGLFALGNRLFQLPMQLLGESIRNAYYKEVIDRIHHDEENCSGFLNLRKHLVGAGMFPFIFLLFFGEFLFGIFFGAQWAEAGTYAGVLGFFFFFQFISTPIASLFNAYQKQRYLMLISALLFANNLLSLLIGAYFGSPIKGFILLTINGIGIYVLMNYLAEKTVGAAHYEQFALYARYLCYSLPGIAVFYLVRQQTQGILAIFATGTILAIFYYIFIYRDKFFIIMKKWGRA
jgi:O-antigen/teichoic acid export membrane protein